MNYFFFIGLALERIFSLKDIDYSATKVFLSMVEDRNDEFGDGGTWPPLKVIS